jgi:hypothetical protein
MNLGGETKNERANLSGIGLNLIEIIFLHGLENLVHKESKNYMKMKN